MASLTHSHDHLRSPISRRRDSREDRGQQDESTPDRSHVGVVTLWQIPVLVEKDPRVFGDNFTDISDVRDFCKRRTAMLGSSEGQLCSLRSNMATLNLKR